jgi:acetyl-CoA carboxylase biotin carboxyl carrier protein
MAKKTTSSPQSAGSFTDTKRVKELVALMADNGLTEIELVEDKSRIVLRRGTVSGGGQMAAPAYAPPAAAAPHPTFTAAPHPAAQAPAAAAPPAPAEDAGLVPIKSPMVGTFYSAPNPDSDAYVSIGKAVDEKSVVCIIEAMKVFNEIHAEVRGTVTKVLASNGQAVEFGQPLFLVKPG